MTTAARALVTVGAALGVSLLWNPRSDAHKPITSPYTFNEDVFPILRTHCGACHVAGGVAPMSLMTHEEAVPWGESMRMELISGHMPPWQVDSPATRFHNAAPLAPRELNVLLTWASGGTPPGAPEKTPPPVTVPRAWPLGTPDLLLPLPPAEVPADRDSLVQEFTLHVGNAERRWLRAVDLRPGTPAIVRSAQVIVASADGQATRGAERLLSLWLPGDPPVALNGSTGLRLPPRAELLVRVQYWKTWQHEREAMSDRSSIGLYFLADGARDMQALVLPVPEGAGASTVTVDRDLQALAVYPDPELTSAGVRLTAIDPAGTRDELIAFRPRAAWARRYWFATPIRLPRGTRLEVSAASDDEAMWLLPPGAPAAPASPNAARRLTLNVVPES